MRIAVVVLVGASGAMETISLAALGHVFAGVMTGNLALLGMSFGRGGGAEGRAAALALLGFAAGAAAVASATRRRVDHQINSRADAGREPEDHWPPRVQACLIAESALLAIGALYWLAIDGHPDATARAILQVGAAATMGAQAAAMVAAGRLAAPTTYLTGTLATYIVRGVSTSGRPDAWVPARLAALVLGAAAAAAVRSAAPGWTAMLPFVLVAGATAALSRGPRRRRA